MERNSDDEQRIVLTEQDPDRLAPVQVIALGVALIAVLAGLAIAVHVTSP